MSKLHEKMNGKNINFLIGSGASCPTFNTLSLGEGKPTLEELLRQEENNEINTMILYYYYYKQWIKPMGNCNYQEQETMSNYSVFVEKIIDILDTNGNERPKRANIFTTNYDLFFENSFEKVFEKRSECYFNDGSSGLIERILRPQNYNLSVSRMGYNDNYKQEIPVINLYKMHGSVSWFKKEDDMIGISYRQADGKINNIPELDSYDFVKDLVKLVECGDYREFDQKLVEISTDIETEIRSFYGYYEKLAIINPNKWKFHDTVFEQHYYQLIRNFSYELEKPNTILVVFAFSFADEHIEEIFKRSLSNPELEVIIICYSSEIKEKLQNQFVGFKNISYYPRTFTNKDGQSLEGNFTYFNNLLNGDYDE